MDDPKRSSIVVRELVRASQRVAENTEMHVERKTVSTELREHRRQGLSLQVFHRDVVPVGVLANLICLHDVRVVQTGREARLLHEQLEEIAVGVELCANTPAPDASLRRAEGSSFNG